MKYFFWHCLNTTECEFNNFNIGTVNAIQNKSVYLDEIGEQIKSSLLLTLLQCVYSYRSFHLPAIQLFISSWKKSYKDIYHSPAHVSVITGNILITITRFSPYHLLVELCWNYFSVHRQGKYYNNLATMRVIGNFIG